MKYDIPILSDTHAEFLKREAARRYDGELIRDDGDYLVEDRDGVCHADAVLRALSRREEERRKMASDSDMKFVVIRGTVALGFIVFGPYNLEEALFCAEVFNSWPGDPGCIMVLHEGPRQDDED